MSGLAPASGGPRSVAIDENATDSPSAEMPSPNTPLRPLPATPAAVVESSSSPASAQACPSASAAVSPIAVISASVLRRVVRLGPGAREPDAAHDRDRRGAAGHVDPVLQEPRVADLPGEQGPVGGRRVPVAPRRVR